jgi:hypothetical protein
MTQHSDLSVLQYQLRGQQLESGCKHASSVPGLAEAGSEAQSCQQSGDVLAPYLRCAMCGCQG